MADDWKAKEAAQREKERTARRGSRAMRTVESGSGDSGRHRSRRAIGPMLVTSALVVGLLGAGSAQGAEITGTGISATVTASVKPSSLPKRKSAPVSVLVTGTVSEAQSQSIKTVTLRLDRQLGVGGRGLPTCQPKQVTGVPPKQARQKCKDALVGGGGLTQRSFYPEQPPLDVHGSLLFFNGAGSRLLTFIHLPGPLAPASIVGSGRAKGRVLEVGIPSGLGGLITDFRFRLGRTWTQKGQRFGYLRGRCTTGKLRNRLTLTPIRGGAASSMLTQRCRGRS